MAMLSLVRADGAQDRRKLELAGFFMARVLPQTAGLALALAGGAGPLMGLGEEEF